jgi:hypothetical protein
MSKPIRRNPGIVDSLRNKWSEDECTSGQKWDDLSEKLQLLRQNKDKDKDGSFVRLSRSITLLSQVDVDRMMFPEKDKRCTERHHVAVFVPAH